jgi:hypothetical protein
MKACIWDPDPYRNTVEKEKSTWTSKTHIHLTRRACRILRAKTYFLFHDRDSGYPRNFLQELMKVFPLEGIIIISFIISLFMLAIFVSCPYFYGRSADYGFFSAISDFMIKTTPVLIVVILSSLALVALNRLAIYYIDMCDLPQK